jgi:hypothetical protein
MSNRDGSLSELTNILFTGNSAGSGGGALLNRESDLKMINVTIAGNHAGNEGGGIYNKLAAPTLTNVILWGNSIDTGYSQIYNEGDPMPVIDHSNVQGSGGSDDWIQNYGTDGGNNIDVDPAFVAPYSDLHLQEKSPAIDAGDDTVCPPVDLDGNRRPFSSTCDMGAYESIESLIYLPLVIR